MCEMAEIVWKIAELLQWTVQLTSTIFPVSMTKNTAHMDEIRYQHVKRKKRALQHKDTGSDEHIEDSAMSDPAGLSNWIDIWGNKLMNCKICESPQV